MLHCKGHEFINHPGSDHSSSGYRIDQSGSTPGCTFGIWLVDYSE